MSLGDSGRTDILPNTPQGIRLDQPALLLEERMIRQTRVRCRCHKGKDAEEQSLCALQRKMRRMTAAREQLTNK